MTVLFLFHLSSLPNVCNCRGKRAIMKSFAMWRVGGGDVQYSTWNREQKLAAIPQVIVSEAADLDMKAAQETNWRVKWNWSKVRRARGLYKKESRSFQRRLILFRFDSFSLRHLVSDSFARRKILGLIILGCCIRRGNHPHMLRAHITTHTNISLCVCALILLEISLW